MAGRVIWTDLAWSEFEAVADYIGRVSPAYAASFVQKVISSVELIAEWPDSGAIVLEFDDPSLREIFVKRYRVIYRPLKDGICIVALIHSARDLPHLWKADERSEN